MILSNILVVNLKQQLKWPVTGWKIHIIKRLILHHLQIETLLIAKLKPRPCYCCYIIFAAF